jgi:hypothetical protein
MNVIHHLASNFELGDSVLFAFLQMVFELLKLVLEVFVGFISAIDID